MFSYQALTTTFLAGAKLPPTYQPFPTVLNVVITGATLRAKSRYPPKTPQLSYLQHLYLHLCSRLGQTKQFYRLLAISTKIISIARLVCNRCSYFPVSSEGCISTNFPNTKIFFIFIFEMPISSFYIESATNWCSELNLICIIRFCIIEVISQHYISDRVIV